MRTMQHPNTGSTLLDVIVGTLFSILPFSLGWIPFESMVETFFITLVTASVGATVSFLVSRFWKANWPELKEWFRRFFKNQDQDNG